MAVYAIVKVSDLMKPRIGKASSWAPHDVVGPTPGSDGDLAHQQMLTAQAITRARNAYNKLRDMRQHRKDFEAGETRWKRIEAR